MMKIELLIDDTDLHRSSIVEELTDVIGHNSYLLGIIQEVRYVDQGQGTITGTAMRSRYRYLNTREEVTT